MVINFMKLNKNAVTPAYATRCSAGLDLCAVSCPNQELVIKPGETKKVHTGITFEIPDGFFGAIYARSGMATKRGLRPSNCVGVIDSDYRGEIIVPLYNDSNMEQKIHDGDRVAQIVIQPYVVVDLYEAADLSSTLRGVGGFGSTGINTSI